MAEDPLQRWQSLLEEVEIVITPFSLTSRLQTASEEQLTEFEQMAGFLLPQGYKEFLQVFGHGMFGYNEFRINCPQVDKSYISTMHLSQSAARIVYEDHRDEVPLEILELFNASFQFGSGSRYYHLFFFDLRSYSELDLSYDFYTLIERKGAHIYNLGRDFFSFIRDVCIGDKAEADFPLLIRKLEDRDQDEREEFLEDMKTIKEFQPRTFHQYAG
jgi:hypothetical protein